MTPLSYNRYSRYLHWLMAALLIFMVILGWRFDSEDSLRLARSGLHKSTGILILVLTLIRIGLRIAYKPPAEIEALKWQMLAAKAAHWGFYGLMLGLPITGWLMVSTSPREIPFYGLFQVPHLPVPVKPAAGWHEAHELFETGHGLLAKLLIYALIPLHIAAALKHHFIDKDVTMSHMVPGLTPKPVANWRWILPAGVLIAGFGLGYGVLMGTPNPKEEEAPAPAEASVSSSASVETASASSSSVSSSSSSSASAAVPTWIVDKAASKLNFISSFEGDKLTGHFSTYQAAITFDPAQLDKSHVKVTFDLASAATGDGDRDTTLKSDAFFGVTTFPKAVFEASKFTATGKDAYLAKGKLTLHGVTKPFDLPFSLVIKDGMADMKATAELDRLTFGVGTGEWQATTSVPAKVKLQFGLKARMGK
jgi:cytochrome b561/polyisoprenoid-binding protein YceI